MEALPGFHPEAFDILARYDMSMAEPDWRKRSFWNYREGSIVKEAVKGRNIELGRDENELLYLGLILHFNTSLESREYRTTRWLGSTLRKGSRFPRYQYYVSAVTGRAPVCPFGHRANCAQEYRSDGTTTKRMAGYLGV